MHNTPAVAPIRLAEIGANCGHGELHAVGMSIAIVGTSRKTWPTEFCFTILARDQFAREIYANFLMSKNAKKDMLQLKY